MTENEISYEIRKAIYEVYNETGPGLLESTYEHAFRNSTSLATNSSSIFWNKMLGSFV